MACEFLKIAWFIWIYKMFLILIPSSFWIHSCANFFLSFDYQHLHSRLLLFISRADLILYFQIKRSSNFSVGILSFGFCLLKSECGALLTVDHCLVYSYLKCLSLILSLITVVKLFFSIHISVSFSLCFLLLDLAGCRIEILSSTFPAFKSCFSICWFGMNANPQYQIKKDIDD